MKKANKQMMELRTGEAASMLAKGHSCTVTTTEMAEKYGLSRRQSYANHSEGNGFDHSRL